MLLVSRAACQTCWCQNFPPTVFRCCKCFKMPFCRHCECELGSLVLLLLTVNRQWFSDSGGKEKQLPRESVLNLRTIILMKWRLTISSSMDLGSEAIKKEEQEINTFTLIILLSASGFGRTWEIVSGKEGSEWLSHFCLFEQRKELKKQEF